MEELKDSVFVEKLIQKGYEVIFFTEAIDEYVMTHLTEFDDKKFQDASKDDLKLGKDDKKGMKKLKVGGIPAEHPAAPGYRLNPALHHHILAITGPLPPQPAHTSHRAASPLKHFAQLPSAQMTPDLQLRSGHVCEVLTMQGASM